MVLKWGLGASEIRGKCPFQTQIYDGCSFLNHCSCQGRLPVGCLAVVQLIQKLKLKLPILEAFLCAW